MIQDAVLIFTIAIALVFLGFFGIVLWKILMNEIDLTYLISEPDRKASLSRFQLLLFTFVVAGLFLVLSIDAGQFVDIPEGALGLIGISGGSFVISKAVGAPRPQQAAARANPPGPPPAGG